MHDLGYVRSTPRRVTLPKDAVRQEANYANNERRQARRQRRWARSAGRAAVRARGEETLSEPESSGDGDEEEDEDEEEGETTPSPPPKTSPCLATSSASKWGSLLERVGRSAPGQEPGHHPTHCHSLISRRHLLTCRG
jgi:hypothetical protein